MKTRSTKNLFFYGFSLFTIITLMDENTGLKMLHVFLHKSCQNCILCKTLQLSSFLIHMVIMITHHPCSFSPGGSLGSCGRGDWLLGPVWRQAGPAAQTRLGAERRRSLQQLHGAVWGPAIHKRYSSSPLDLLQYQREHLFSHCYSSRFILWSGLCYVVLWCMLFEAWQFQSLFTFIILICNVI